MYVANNDLSNTAEIQSSTLCYKNGPHLPPLNFTSICIEYGRYVIFYNERLDGVTYPEGYELYNVFTELCEVLVQGKLAGLIIVLSQNRYSLAQFIYHILWVLAVLWNAKCLTKY